MKKIILFVLCLSTITAFSGCGKKKDIKKEIPNNEVVSQQTEEEKVETSLVGTWVVTKTEVYDGPMKSMTEQLANTYYYIGAEYEFTDDGIFKSVDGKLSTNYSILSDNLIHMKVVAGDGTRSENVNEYELNGDEFILYGNYYSDSNSTKPLGRISATYFKRK